MPFARLDKSILLAELNLIIQCSGIWCAAGFQRWKPAMLHWSPLIIIAEEHRMQYSLCFVEIWCCIVMSLEKCLIVGNKRVVARGGLGWWMTEKGGGDWDSRLFIEGTVGFLCCHCLRSAPFYGKIAYRTWALMLIGACVLPEQRLMGRKPCSKNSTASGN